MIESSRTDTKWTFGWELTLKLEIICRYLTHLRLVSKLLCIDGSNIFVIAYNDSLTAVPFLYYANKPTYTIIIQVKARIILRTLKTVDSKGA